MRFAATRLLAGGAICIAAKRAAASADSASSDSSGKPAPPQSDCELDAAHLSHRRVFLLGDVTDDSANALIKRLLWLEAASPGEPIEFVINSSGGSLWAGFALFDTLRAVSSPVHTVCLGRCRSMAAVLLAAGEPGHRYAAASASPCDLSRAEAMPGMRVLASPLGAPDDPP